MKSKTSLFNKAIVRRNLTGHIGLWAAFLFLWLSALPLNVYIRMQWFSRYSDINGMAAQDLATAKANAMINAVWDNQSFFVVLFAVMAVISAMFLFSYLFTARNANMMHTFPVSRMSLFRTNYITGLLYQVVPLAAGILLSLLIGASMGAVTGLVVKQYLIWIGVAVVEIVFFFSMSVCVLMFSGNSIAVPVFYGILNFLYAGCLLTAEAMVDSTCYGVNADLLARASRSMLTPVMYMRYINVEAVEEGTGYLLSGTKALAGYLAAAVIFILIAVIAYQKKHIETAGDVITVGWLKPIFRWGASICFSAVGAVFFTQMTYQKSFALLLISGAVIGSIVFFVSQMLLERSVRVFTKKRVREGILYLVCICAAYFALDADVFGLEGKVPDIDEVKAINMADSYAVSNEEVALIQDIHRQIIASKSEFEHYDGDTIYFSLCYELKDGGSLERNYDIPIDMAPESIYSKLEQYASKPEVIERRYFGIHYPDIEVTAAFLEDYDEAGKSRRISEKDAKKLYEAMIKDIQAGNFSVSEDIEAVNTNWNICLTFEVFDEQGFQTPESMYYGYYYEGDHGTTPNIWLSSTYENLIRQLRKMGYLEEE